MTVLTVITFSHDRGAAVAALDAVAAGRGWCNVSPDVEEEIPDMKVNYFGLRLNKGVTMASFVTAPARHGTVPPSTRRSRLPYPSVPTPG